MGFWEQCPAWGLPLAGAPGKLPLWPPDLGKSQILKACLSSFGLGLPLPLQRAPTPNQWKRVDYELQFLLTPGLSGASFPVCISGTEKQNSVNWGTWLLQSLGTYKVYTPLPPVSRAPCFLPSPLSGAQMGLFIS